MKRASIYTLNLVRWLQHHILSWGVLGILYVAVFLLLTQPMLPKLFGGEVRWEVSLPILAAAWFVIGVWERVGSALPPLRVSLLSKTPLVTPLRKLGGIYFSQSARKWSYWTSALAVGVLGAWVLGRWPLALFLVMQWSAQRELIHVQNWRRLMVLPFPQSGALRLMNALWISGVIHAALIFVVAMSVSFFVTPGFDLPFSQLIRIGIAGFVGVWLSLALAFEGDSGRPFLVNMISLGGGLLAGYLTLITLWAAPIALYFAFQMRGVVANRLKSVENFHEDTIF